MNKLLYFLCVVIISCSKQSDPTQDYGFPKTYIDHQFKDKLTATQIVEKIDTYIPGAASLLHTKYDVTVYRISYHTHDYKNNPVVASGLIYIPEITYSVVPVISYQHGTAIRKTEVPSISGDVDYYMPFMLASETGAVVCEADYIGLGFSEGVHHYFEPYEEANAVIDLIRSVSTTFEKTLRPMVFSGDVFLTGYSQGGHATLAAQRDIETQYSGEFQLIASAPMASFFSFEKSSQLNVLKDSLSYSATSVYPYLLQSVNITQHVYSNFSQLFIPPYDSLVNVLFDGNHDATYTNSLFPEYISTVLQPSFKNDLKYNPENIFLQAIKNYDVINGWIPRSPTHFYHSESDEIAFYDNSLIAYNTFKSAGGNAELISLGHLSHLDGNIAGIKKLREWFYPMIHVVSYR